MVEGGPPARAVAAARWACSATASAMVTSQQGGWSRYLSASARGSTEACAAQWSLALRRLQPATVLVARGLFSSWALGLSLVRLRLRRPARRRPPPQVTCLCGLRASWVTAKSRLSAPNHQSNKGVCIGKFLIQLASMIHFSRVLVIIRPRITWESWDLLLTPLFLHDSPYFPAHRLGGGAILYTFRSASLSQLIRDTAVLRCVAPQRQRRPSKIDDSSVGSQKRVVAAQIDAAAEPRTKYGWTKAGRPIRLGRSKAQLRATTLQLQVVKLPASTSSDTSLGHDP